MRRAVRLTESPMMVNVRRYAVPMSQANTWPRFTPTLTGRGRGSSMSMRTARSSRPSSSSCVVGTPAVRMIFPPLASMSEDKKVTDSRSAAR